LIHTVSELAEHMLTWYTASP